MFYFKISYIYELKKINIIVLKIVKHIFYFQSSAFLGHLDTANKNKLFTKIEYIRVLHISF